MSERFKVVPVAAHESAFGDETDGDAVFDAGVGERERAERRDSSKPWRTFTSRTS